MPWALGVPVILQARRIAQTCAALVLIASLTVGGVRSPQQLASTTDANASTLAPKRKLPECGRAVTVPFRGQNLREYFDGLRFGMGLLDQHGLPPGALADAAKCTKKDVCLLMRQLDMDFYERARAGTLTDSDYDNPPEAHVLHSGTCASQSRGFRMQPIMDVPTCTREATRMQGIQGRAEIVFEPGLPQGCIITQGKACVNKAQNHIATAGVSYKFGRKHVTLQICQMDRRLEESAAAYYSPYKLKKSMLGRESHSTSCSFGMYAFLSKLRLTDSHCARILTYKESVHFHSAQDARDFAAILERQGKHEEAEKVLTYVETIRQKFVLVDAVANDWCPDIWTKSLATNAATCAVPRVMSWTAQGIEKAAAERKRLEAATKLKAATRAAAVQDQNLMIVGNRVELSRRDEVPKELVALRSSIGEEDQRAAGLKDDNRTSSKPRKLALEARACETLEDVSLAELLAGVPEAPPDFFERAYVPEM